MKKKTSFSLSPEAITLLKLLAGKDGISMTAEIELAIRERAERRQISTGVQKDTNQ